jgi:hypothetical protein
MTCHYGVRLGQLLHAQKYEAQSTVFIESNVIDLVGTRDNAIDERQTSARHVILSRGS